MAFLGALCLLKLGQAAESEKLHLRWVKDNGAKDFVEYGMSVAELKRLEAGDSPERLAGPRGLSPKNRPRP